MVSELFFPRHMLVASRIGCNKVKSTADLPPSVRHLLTKALGRKSSGRVIGLVRNATGCRRR